MARDEAGGLPELARIQLKVEGEGELLEPGESPPPRRLIEEVPAPLVAGPRGLVVHDLPDPAEPGAAREVVEDGGKVRVLERGRGDDDVVERRVGQLPGDPPRLRHARSGEGRPVLLDVADAHRLDEGASGELEPLDREVRLVARPAVDRVAVHRRELARVMAARRPRADVPEMEVRVPELHVVERAGTRGAGSRRLAAAGFLVGTVRETGSRRQRAFSGPPPPRCPCRRRRTAPSAPAVPSPGSGPCGWCRCPCARR